MHYVDSELLYCLQSAGSAMRRTLRPAKAAVAPTGNRMLDIAIRMAGNLEQQEKQDAADAAADQCAPHPAALLMVQCYTALQV